MKQLVSSRTFALTTARLHALQDRKDEFTKLVPEGFAGHQLSKKRENYLSSTTIVLSSIAEHAASNAPFPFT